MADQVREARQKLMLLIGRHGNVRWSEGHADGNDQQGLAEEYAKRADALLEEISAATAPHAAEVEALRADAERYRWLRQHAHARTYRDVRCFVEVPRGPCDPELLEVRGQKLDEAIDAALKGDKP